MLFAMLLLLLPLLLFFLDVIGKIIIGHSIKTAGADLCMFALSFHVSTLLIDQMTEALVSHSEPEKALQLYLISLSLMFISLIFWLLGLHVAGERFDNALNGWVSTKMRIQKRLPPGSLGFVFSIVLGIGSVFTVFLVLEQLPIK